MPRRVQLGAFTPRKFDDSAHISSASNCAPSDRTRLKTPAHRLETYMDDRTVVPSGLSDAPPLDGKTNIPAHLPLGVLVDRTLVPRGMPAIPIERFQPIYESVPIAVLDSRVVVPAYVEPADAEERLEFEHAPEMTDQLREVIEPDIFMTGDANLLMEARGKRDPKSDLLTRVLSVLVHIGLIIFLILRRKSSRRTSRPTKKSRWPRGT